MHVGNGWSAERSLEGDVVDSCLFLHESEEFSSFLVDSGEVSVSSLAGQD